MSQMNALKKNILSRSFYIQPTLAVARQLLGKYLVHNTVQGKLVGKIVETEAYIGPRDKASHSYGGKMTERNKAEFLIGGHVYIYLVYGMYWQMNITTEDSDVLGCVLIRALEPIGGLEQMKALRYNKDTRNLTNGPGKLCMAMQLDKSLYGVDLANNKIIYLEDRGDRVRLSGVISCARIGIDYAGPYWAKRKWRFYIKNNQFVSKY